MKVGILTFHASHNYGSMLQAWALQTYLEKQGYDVKIINFRSVNQKKLYAFPINFSSFPLIKSSIKNIIKSPFRTFGKCRKWMRFERFLKNKFHTTKVYTSLEDLKGVDSQFDVIITGSDQIWNTSIYDFSTAYYGSFVNGSTTLVAYGPSMGPKPFVAVKSVSHLKPLLEKYKAISVREDLTKQLLQDSGYSSPISLVLDPTLLLEPDDYDKIIPSIRYINENYIFYYTPWDNDDYLREASKLGKKLGLKVVCTIDHPKSDFDNVIFYTNCGPSEFLTLLKNAQVCCGWSFHLVVFSLLFKKKCYCLNSKTDSRIINLLKLLNIDYNIDSNGTICVESQFDMEKRLLSCRKTSIDFLMNNL